MTIDEPMDPIWNHYIRDLVVIWSVDDGPDERALAALAHLREVRDKYWEYGWRREHRGYGRYPENELWDAVEGYLDLLDASWSSDTEA